MDKSCADYFKVIIYHFTLPPPPQTIRHIDCLGTFFEAVIYQYKNNEGMVIIDCLGKHFEAVIYHCQEVSSYGNYHTEF